MTETFEGGSNMTYREKFAWLSLAAIAVTYGPYFAITAANRPDAEVPNLGQLRLFAITMVVQMAILIVGRLVLRRLAPEEAGAPPDERDRAIESRAFTFAYYVLISGMIVVGCVMPFQSGGWTIVNAALLAIVAAEVVHYGVAVTGYRRQS